MFAKGVEHEVGSHRSRFDEYLWSRTGVVSVLKGRFCLIGRRLVPSAVWVGLILLNVVVVTPQSGRTEPGEVDCPSLLGIGLVTGHSYCDVLIGTEAAEGIIVAVPPHAGPAIVTFTLHGRHTYSEEATTRGRGYARYLAITAVVAGDEVLARPVLLAEFHDAEDLVDRVGGGAGPAGLKAVAPVGGEDIRVTVPPGVNEVAIVGLQLEVERVDGREVFVTPGRSIAVIGDVQVEYRSR